MSVRLSDGAQQEVVHVDVLRRLEDVQDRLGHVVGMDVMLYIAPGHQLDLGGTGSVTLSPRTSGIYRGITVFQDRNSTTEVKLHGNGALRASGTLYAARAMFNMVGNGATDQFGSQLICWNLNLSGNGNIKINWLAEDTARVRVIRLVE